MLLALLASAVLAGPQVWTGATVFVDGSRFVEDGVLVVEDGVVVAVGPASEVAVPDGAEVVDLSGRVVIPGLVDTHSHIANTGDLNESSGPLQPGLSALDALDVTLPSVMRARAGGITTVNVMPGSGNLMGGQTAYLKLRDVPTVDGMLFCADRRTGICGGMKMANGTNSRRGGAYPSTRMGSAAQVRGLFLGAQKHRAELEGGGEDGKKKKRKKGADQAEGSDEVPLAKRDFAQDAVLQLMDGERTVHFHTHRADDVATAIGLSEEFGFEVVLHHVSEAWKVADLIAEHDVAVSLILIDSPGGKEEAVEIKLENAALLQERGVLVSLHTDDPITDSRLFLRSGALAIRGGMKPPAALDALTINGAKQLHLDDRVGSLEPGKDADFVVLSGLPFSVWTHVEQTWIEGELVFDRANPEHRPYATGGDQVPERVPTLGRGAP